MPDYALVPVDHQPDFDDHSLVPVDYDPFMADDIIQRARTQQESQQQTGAGFDQPPSAPPLPPIVPNDGQGASAPQPPGQDPHSQYQALRPMPGDRNAILATVYPEIRQTLMIAQALAGQQQPGQTSEPAPTGHVSGVTQQAQAPTQPAQPQPQTQPQQPATGVDQPNVNAPVAGGSAPGGSQGGGAPGNIGGAAGGGPNTASDQGGAEPAPFGGYANPTPTQSLVNKVQMDDLAAEIDADLTGRRGSDFEAGKAKSYRFVTTKPALDPHQIGEAGITFIAISPFHANDGARSAIIDASPEHPLRVTVTDDGKLTISPP